MRSGRKTELMDQLARYGYALSVPGDFAPPEKVLTELLRQDDPRLLEGFPVVLARALSEKERLVWENPDWSPQKHLPGSLRSRWTAFLVLSLLLFRLFGLDKPSADRVLKLLKKSPDSEKALASLEKDLMGAGRFEAAGMKLSAERLKNSFLNYAVHASRPGELREQKEALELELLLSELFTARQKELLKKRLSGKPFTKTEKEYYYRVVKKRLKALADERVHQLARKLVFS